MTQRVWRFVLQLSIASFCFACEDKPRPNAFDPPPGAPKPLPALTEVPKPEGPPQLAIDDLSPKVGFSRLLLREGRDAAQDRAKLTQELKQNAKFFEGRTVPLLVDRKAKTDWVAAMIDELSAVGVEAVEIETETREEFRKKLIFTPQQKAANAPRCSLVAMVLDDRATAVWRLSGGVAARRSKGMAGPDLSMTGITIERMAKGCKESPYFFVSGDPVVEWGLVYDLAASVHVLEKADFEKHVLLGETPIAGRPVTL